MKQLGLFGLSKRLKDLSKNGDPLEKLSQIVDFEQFRCELDKGLNFSERLKGGRPPHDAVVVFKILILQTLYNLSDDQIEYQIQDRLSFMRFLGLHLSDKVPDSKTIWLYRERFSKGGLMDRLFAKFGDILVNQGYLAMGGQIVDASIIQAPRQRMTKAEKEQVKKGEIPKDWQAKPNQLAQKDLDARWMVKYTKAKDDTKGAVDLAIPFFGYKNHLSTDRRFGFIRKSEVTAANVFDGHILPDLLDSANTCRGYGLQHGRKSDPFGKERFSLQASLQKAKKEDDVNSNQKGKHNKIKNPCSCGTCVCCSKRADGIICQNYWPETG